MRQLPTEIRKALLQDLEESYNCYVKTTQKNTPVATKHGYLLSMFCSAEESIKENFKKNISAHNHFDQEEKRMLIQIFTRAFDGESPLSITKLSPVPEGIESNPVADFMKRFADALDSTFNESVYEDEMPILRSRRTRSEPIPIPIPSPSPSPSNFL